MGQRAMVCARAQLGTKKTEILGYFRAVSEISQKERGTLPGEKEKIVCKEKKAHQEDLKPSTSFSRPVEKFSRTAGCEDRKEDKILRVLHQNDQNTKEKKKASNPFGLNKSRMRRT